MNIFGAGMYIKQLADKINELIVNEVNRLQKGTYYACSVRSQFPFCGIVICGNIREAHLWECHSR